MQTYNRTGSPTRAHLLNLGGAVNTAHIVIQLSYYYELYIFYG
ncbi:hypothetical protein QEG73_17300 [Chitinophagaceae bacterium 26-R-25]|nr:hypothetical protein [Chitinophagaceae bacterium 26-R-25]